MPGERNLTPPFSQPEPQWLICSLRFARDYWEVFKPGIAIKETCTAGGAYKMGEQSVKMMDVWQKGGCEPLGFGDGGFVKQSEKEVRQFEVEVEKVRHAGEDMYFARAALERGSSV